MGGGGAFLLSHLCLPKLGENQSVSLDIKLNRFSKETSTKIANELICAVDNPYKNSQCNPWNDQHVLGKM